MVEHLTVNQVVAGSSPAGGGLRLGRLRDLAQSKSLIKEKEYSLKNEVG